MRFLYVAATAVLLSPVSATFGPSYDNDGSLSKPSENNAPEYYKDCDCDDKDKDDKKDDKKDDYDSDDEDDKYKYHKTKTYDLPKSVGPKPGKDYMTVSWVDSPKHPKPTEVAPPGHPSILPPGPPMHPAPPAYPAPPAPPAPSAPPVVVIPIPSPPKVEPPPVIPIPAPGPPKVEPSPPAVIPPPAEPVSSSIVPVVVVPTPQPVPTLVPSASSRLPPSSTGTPQRGNVTTPSTPVFTGTAVVSTSQCVSLLLTIGTVWLATVLL